MSTCLPRCVAFDERRELREGGVGVGENAVEALEKLVVAHNQLRGSSGVSICTFLLVRVRENAVVALEKKKTCRRALSTGHPDILVPGYRLQIF